MSREREYWKQMSWEWESLENIKVRKNTGTEFEVGKNTGT